MCVNFSIDPFWRISLLYVLVFHTRTTKVVQQLINLDLCIYWVTYYFIKQHVKFLNKVNKDETVIIVVGNEKISVVTYGLAMSAGQIGDMITVKNIKSKNTFKAIVLDEKKVTPLTNM